MSLWTEIECTRGEIKRLLVALAENPSAGRYVRALDARVAEYEKLIDQLSGSKRMASAKEGVA